MIPILAAALLGAGLFLSLCDIRRVPTLRTAGAVTVTIKRQKQKDGMLQRWPAGFGGVAGKTAAAQ